ncbi:MAG: hypothetical protein KGI75_14440 [Rhizobiaceae bacterium]|nr:hypothetical protein [Rhizobiaceae bacterium]
MTDEAKTLENAGRTRAGKPRHFGIDHKTHKLAIGTIRVPFPRSRLARVVIGIGLIIGGLLGFLPILGFWMLPLGFMVLSHDLPVVRRWRRQLAVWWAKRRRATH